MGKGLLFFATLALLLLPACRQYRPAQKKNCWKAVPVTALPGYGGRIAHWDTLPGHLKSTISHLEARQLVPESDMSPFMDRASTLRMLRDLESAASKGEEAFWEALGRRFVLLRLEGQANGVFVTGYYTPEFDASLKADGEFRYPIYCPPGDLAEKREKYSREAIDRDGCLRERNLELAFVRDPLEAYLLQVQGNGTLILPDKSRMSVGYGATNGMPYVSMGAQLVKDGRISREDISLFTIRSYFAEHPDEFQDYALRNPRYVFFQRMDGPPRGSMGAAVSAMHSIATERYADGRYRFPAFAPVFLRINLPRDGGVRQDAELVFVLNQDTGSAITGDARLDLYTGTGPESEKVAGELKGRGFIYMLWPSAKSLPEQIGGMPVKNGLRAGD